MATATCMAFVTHVFCNSMRFDGGWHGMLTSSSSSVSSSSAAKAGLSGDVPWEPPPCTLYPGPRLEVPVLLWCSNKAVCSASIFSPRSRANSGADCKMQGRCQTQEAAGNRDDGQSRQSLPTQNTARNGRSFDINQYLEQLFPHTQARERGSGFVCHVADASLLKSYAKTVSGALSQATPHGGCA